MIIQIKDNIVIEVIRHNEIQDFHNHFVEECGWSEYDFTQIEDFDWFCVEIKATNQDLKSNSAYLGTCCAESFKEFIKRDLDGYKDQLISEAIEGLNNESK